MLWGNTLFILLENSNFYVLIPAVEIASTEKVLDTKVRPDLVQDRSAQVWLRESFFWYYLTPGDAQKSLVPLWILVSPLDAEIETDGHAWSEAQWGSSLTQVPLEISSSWGFGAASTRWCADQHGGEGRDEGAKAKCDALLTGNSKKWETET